MQHNKKPLLAILENNKEVIIAGLSNFKILINNDFIEDNIILKNNKFKKFISDSKIINLQIIAKGIFINSNSYYLFNQISIDKTNIDLRIILNKNSKIDAKMIIKDFEINSEFNGFTSFNCNLISLDEIKFLN